MLFGFDKADNGAVLGVIPCATIVFIICAKGSVLNFVSMPFILILEAGCGQSPQNLVNTGNSGNVLYWKSQENKILKTQN